MTVSRTSIGWAAALIAIPVLMGYLWLSQPKDPLKYFNPGIVKSLSVTVKSGPFPAEVRNDELIPINIQFLRPNLPTSREYAGMIFLRNVGASYPKTAVLPVTVIRVRTEGEPREGLTIQRNDQLIDVTPPPRPKDDPNCHYFAMLNPASLPKHVNPIQPIELHLWIYERDSGGLPGGAPAPSVLIYKTTFGVTASTVSK